MTVLKVWDDNDNQDGFRPPSVEILLFANGNNTKNATLDESNNWTFTFYNLDKYFNGTEIVYRINETRV